MKILNTLILFLVVQVEIVYLTHRTDSEYMLDEILKGEKKTYVKLSKENNNL